ncbi:MAG: Yip1 family protein [Candidatus Omnitrophota bacterium]|nr:Yip1 family protein [Candidatus Omnitrophota bacterium]
MTLLIIAIILIIVAVILFVQKDGEQTSPEILIRTLNPDPFQENASTDASVPMIPWEQRPTKGLLKAFGETVWLILLNPNDFFEQLTIKKNIKDPFLFSTCIYVIVSLMYFLTGSVTNGLMQLAMIVGIFALTFFMHIWIFLLRGNQGYRGTFHVIAYTTAPLLFSVVPVIGGIVAGLWTIPLGIIGYKHVHRFGTLTAVIAFIIGPLTVLLLPLVIAILKQL